MTDKQQAKIVEQMNKDLKQGRAKAEKLSSKQQQKIAIEFIEKNNCTTLRRKNGVNKK